jgi:hypothetical protein
VRSLNDDELNSLLRQAKVSPPKPSPGFAARAKRAYERQSSRSSVWHRLLFGTIRMPIPIGVIASIILILVGAVFGHKLGQTRTVELPTVQKRAATNVVDRDRPVLNLYGLQPVTELHPRIIRRVHEDR